MNPLLRENPFRWTKRKATRESRHHKPFRIHPCPCHPCRRRRLSHRSSAWSAMRPLQSADCRIADAVSAVFVPAVIGVAVLVMIVWILLSAPVAKALEYAICVLVISCPCALGLAAVAIMVGSGVGAKNGILFKTSESLENAGKIQIVALDKTGTVTEGKPKLPAFILRDI